MSNLMSIKRKKLKCGLYYFHSRIYVKRIKSLWLASNHSINWQIILMKKRSVFEICFVLSSSYSAKEIVSEKPSRSVVKFLFTFFKVKAPCLLFQSFIIKYKMLASLIFRLWSGLDHDLHLVRLMNQHIHNLKRGSWDVVIWKL